MNLHFSFKQTRKTDAIDKLVARRVGKVNKLLGTFNPDLVHLHGTLSEPNPREGFVTSLNLRLPIGQIQSTHAAKTASSSLRAAFDDLERQINKEKELLRGDGKHMARTQVKAGEAEAGLPRVSPRRSKPRSSALTSF